MPDTIDADTRPHTKAPSGSGGGRKHVVIVGAGFAGLACAQRLGKADIDVTVIDRRNHNLFQPLLYQVATAALSPADIAEPIRRTLGRYKNIRVILAEVNGVDPQGRVVALDKDRSVSYDHLVLATGSQYNYFGNDSWRTWAPGLKTVHEARLIRQRLLLAFERAELSTDPDEQRALLTSVIIGGGPTGVEMAGAISELGRFMVSRDFRNLEADRLRIVLVEAGPKLLAGFPDVLSDYAAQHLRKIGVEVRIDQPVEDVSENTVTVGQERLEAGCIVWAAGIKPSPAARWLGLEEAAGGRVPVDDRLEVRGFPGIFAIGDTAGATGGDGKGLPALAQVAKQQGRYLGDALVARCTGKAQTAPFRFRDRGNTAVIGRNAAIFDFGRWHLKGRFAWFLWALIHVYLLVNFEKRILVGLQWVWRYITRNRGARLIDESSRYVPSTTQRSET